jgi:hypothetical protein
MGGTGRLQKAIVCALARFAGSQFVSRAEMAARNAAASWPTVRCLPMRQSPAHDLVPHAGGRP